MNLFINIVYNQNLFHNDKLKQKLSISTFNKIYHFSILSSLLFPPLAVSLPPPGPSAPAHGDRASSGPWWPRLVRTPFLVLLLHSLCAQYDLRMSAHHSGNRLVLRLTIEFLKNPDYSIMKKIVYYLRRLLRKL